MKDFKDAILVLDDMGDNLNKQKKTFILEVE